MTKIKLLSLLFLISVTKLSSQNADINMLRRINADSSFAADKLFRGVSFSVLPISLASPASIILTGFIRNDEVMKRDGYRATASLLLAGAIGTSLKFAFKRERPFKTYDFIHGKDKVGPMSFPSNHTTLAFATATSLSLACPKWYVIVPSYLWASSVAYSRMYLGVHYPSDVLGGIVIGIGSSLLVWQVDKWMMGRN